MLISNKNIMGIATRTWLKGSTEGVIMAEIIKAASMAYFLCFARVTELIMPSFPSSKATRGSSKTTPQDIMTERAKEK